MAILNVVQRTRTFGRIASTADDTPSTSPPKCGEWNLTRRVRADGRWKLFRARTATELGPGCYLIRRPRHTNDSVARLMLLREATVSEHVACSHLGCILARSSDDAGQFNVLPFLDGITVGHLMAARTTPLPVVEALAIGRQVAAALATLHAAGWLHGRVQPDHVLISSQRQTTLLNLTSARRVNSSECDVKDWPCSILARLAPETLSGQLRLTSAIDVYALGTLIYELVVGRPPFAADCDRRLVKSHLRDRPIDLRQTRSEVSPEMNELVLRMLAKEPLRRPRAEEVVRWLAEIEIEALRLL